METVTIEEYRQILKDWQIWINTYYVLIGPNKLLLNLIEKTSDILARGEMK